MIAIVFDAGDSILPEKPKAVMLSQNKVPGCWGSSISPIIRRNPGARCGIAVRVRSERPEFWYPSVFSNPADASAAGLL
jgi:hypothetical protein